MLRSCRHVQRALLQTGSQKSSIHFPSTRQPSSNSPVQVNANRIITTPGSPGESALGSRVHRTSHEADLLMAPRPKRIVVGITGATGAVYAIRMLELLRQLRIETHLVISKWALATLKYETDFSEAHIRGLAHANYTAKDLSAPMASGSFQHDGMVIVPCSMKTLAAVRIGFCDDLISRAGDVCLKEGRKLVLVVRETPLSDIHLENMLALRRAGATIFPPVPAFYTRPRDLDDMVAQSVGRMLDSLGIFTNHFHRWNGFERSKESPARGSSRAPEESC